MGEPKLEFEQLNKEVSTPIGNLLSKILDDDRVPCEVRLEYYKAFVEVLSAPKFIVRFEEKENKRLMSDFLKF